MKATATVLATLLAGFAIVAGCSKGDDKSCTPGKTVYCRCAEPGTDGVKLCAADGKSFGECNCGSGSTSVEAETETALGATTPAETSSPDPEPEEDAGGSVVDAGMPVREAGASPEAGTAEAGARRDAGSPIIGVDGEGPNCSPLENIGQAVIEEAVADDAPTVTKGGTVSDGTYVLTFFVKLTGGTGKSGPLTRKSIQTLEISEGKFGRMVSAESGKRATQECFSFDAKDGKFAMKSVMPAGKRPKTLTYEATDGTLIIYDAKTARVYTRQ